MRDFSPDHRWLSINTATVRGAGTLDRIIEACARRGIRAISPWRDQVAAIGLERIAAAGARPRHRAVGLLPRRHVPGDRRGRPAAALDDNRRAVDEAKTLDAACLVLVVGGLPGALAGEPQIEGHPRGAPRGARRHRRDARVRAGASACRSRSSRCTRCTPPTAPASTRWSRRSTCATRSIRGRRRRRVAGALAALGVAVDVYHVWWDPKLEAQIARAGARAPARLPRLRLAGADARPAERPRHDGRRRDRHPADPRLGRGRRLRRLQRGRDLLERELVEAAGDEVLDTCIERHRSAV